MAATSLQLLTKFLTGDESILMQDLIHHLLFAVPKLDTHNIATQPANVGKHPALKEFISEKAWNKRTKTMAMYPAF